MKSYSPFFETRHDEQGPVGLLGRGTHYSVLCFPRWQSPYGEHSEGAQRQHIAVIWDEDHDERVIWVIEELFFEGLLWPIMFIGERKGALFLVLSEEAVAAMGDDGLQSYIKEVDSIGNAIEDDPWPVNSCTMYGEGNYNMANDNPDKVELYLDNIHMLWNLG